MAAEKSAYAEKLAATMDEPRYYIATMVSQNEENELRIEKHRKQRAELEFHTIEEPCYVSKVEIPVASLVLLEDASNLLANMMFVEHGTEVTVKFYLGKCLRRQKTSLCDSGCKDSQKRPLEDHDEVCTEAG